MGISVIGGLGTGLTEGFIQGGLLQQRRQELDLNRKRLDAQAKQMDAENELTKIRLQSLIRLPSLMASFQNPAQVGAPALPPPTPGPGGAMIPFQGPEMAGDQPREMGGQLGQLFQAATLMGGDPMAMLQFAALQNPQLADLLAKQETFKLSPGERVQRGGRIIAEGGAPIKTPHFATYTDELGNVHQVVSDPLTGKATSDEVIGKAPIAPKAVSDENRVAQELYDMDYIALTQSRKAAVNKRLQREKVEVAGAVAGIKGDVEQKQPLPASEANILGMPFGTTREQARGVMAMTAQQRDSLAAFDKARGIIGDIRQYSERVNQSAGGLAGRAKQSMRLWGAWTQSDPDAALLMSKAGELANLARSMGEKGALADKDVARAAALVPNVLDTRQVAQQKIIDMLAIIDKGEESFRKSLGPNAQGVVTPTPKSAMGTAPPEDEQSEHDFLAGLPLQSRTIYEGLTGQDKENFKRGYLKSGKEKSVQQR